MTTPSLGSSPGIRRSSGSPSRRTPTRSASAVTSHARPRSADQDPSMNQSRRGPGDARRSTSPSAGAETASESTGGTGRAGADPTGSTSPTATGAGPTRESRSVAREPSTRATSIPPRTATYQRIPASATPIASASPASSSTAAAYGAGRDPRPAVRTSGPTAPVTATHTAAVARSTASPSTISRPAVPGSLPTRRFASARARGSRAPEGETPMPPWPGRPASWTSMSGPVRSTTRPAAAVATARRPRRGAVAPLTRRPRGSARRIRVAAGPPAPAPDPTAPPASCR